MLSQRKKKNVSRLQRGNNLLQIISANLSERYILRYFNCSLPARINSSLITRRSNMNYFIYYL